LFAIATIVELFVVDGIRHPFADALLALVWTVPYGLRDRLPVAPPFIAAAGLATFGIVEGHGTESTTLPFIAALLTAATAGALPDRRQRIMGWTAIICAAAIVDYRSSNTAADFFWTTLILSLAWFFGVVLASRTAQTRELRERVATAERERMLAVERAAAEERARIARELHDVVAHSVSVMVVQASGVRRLLNDDQQREREALLSVEHIGREALTEMRRMLGVMRTGEERPADLAPQPGLKGIDRLIAQVEEAGLPVTLHVEGERPELPVGIDLAAYRIVQEGLTNALKHAKGARADVLIRYGDGGVEVEISDDGPGVNGSGPRSDGHGLVGMRERVALYGGTLDAGPRDGGGFVLRAQLPVEVHA
jgi:signal transduction histidine kinase